jgi:hypothetical protein
MPSRRAPKRAGRQEDKPRRESVKEFQRYEQFACLQPVDARDAEGEEAQGYQWKSTQLTFTALAFASLA